MSARVVGPGIRASLAALAALSLLAAGCSDGSAPTSAGGAALPQSPPQSPPEASPQAPAEEHVYIANAQGTGVTRLTLGSWPAWSPDGRRIAFQRHGEVRVIDVDGTHESRVASGGSPAWSPDGARIAFASGEGIGVIDFDVFEVTTVVRHDFRDDTYEATDMGVGSPAWSPDGALIAFEHMGDGDTQPGQVYIVGADGADVRPLVIRGDRSRWAEYHPSWSPDGARVVFWSYRSGVSTIGRAGGEPSALFPASYGSRPAWSPDGRTVAFTGDRYGRVPVILTWSAGSGARVVIRDGYDAAWSPDGDRIAFVSRRVE